jgi:hypothetical protein
MRLEEVEGGGINLQGFKLVRHPDEMGDEEITAYFRQD